MIGSRLCLGSLLVLLVSRGLLAQQQPVPEEDPRARAIREAYEEQIRRERQLISIRAQNRPVKEVVEQFRQQSGVNIVLDERNFPEPFVVREFIVENEPFSRALEAFAAQMELMIEDLSSTLVRLSRPPRVTFNFREADVRVVLDMIARVSGANMVVSSDVKGSISLAIHNLPWTEVLAAVVKTLGFTTVKEDFGIIRVIHPDELLKQLETRVFRLRHIAPPPIYQAAVDTARNKFVSGRPIQPAQEIEELLKRFILKKVLETVLSKDARGGVVGRLDFDPQTNAFIVTDTKVVLDKVGEIINMLDAEPHQVIVDVKFISTTNEDLLSFGMNYSFGGEPGVGFRQTVLDPGTFTPPGAAGPVSGKITRLPFGFGHEVGNPGDQFFLTEYDMLMAFRAFKRDRFSRLVQEPTLSILDNTEATIFVGETIAYAETRSEATQFGGIVFTLGEAAGSPVKIGFQLFIIPKIVQESNKVILTVIPQNEFLSGQSGVAAVPGFERFTLAGAGVGGTTATIDLPRVSTNTLYTRLILESGRTAVLGGLVLERASFQDEGIPVLKDLPLISYLFKQRNDTVRKEHLLIFITPRIVRAGDGPSKHLKELLKMREDAERKQYEEMRRKSSGEVPEAAPEEKKK